MARKRYADDYTRVIGSRNYIGLEIVESRDIADRLKARLREKLILSQVVKLPATGSASGRNTCLTERYLVMIPMHLTNAEHDTIDTVVDDFWKSEGQE